MVDAEKADGYISAAIWGRAGQVWMPSVVAGVSWRGAKGAPAGEGEDRGGEEREEGQQPASEGGEMHRAVQCAKHQASRVADDESQRELFGDFARGAVMFFSCLIP